MAGKLADRHPLQREAYDKSYAQGFEATRQALGEGRTAQDVYFAAHGQAGGRG